jgi:acyl dehydratase
MITKFGEATLDPDPMHIDPAWSRENSPYGGTIAFGFLTSSLLTHLLYGALNRNLVQDASKQGHVMNYGLDYLRFISPVPVNSKIRGHFKVLENSVDKKGRNIVKFGCEIKIEGLEKPALIAEWLGILIPHN